MKNFTRYLPWRKPHPSPQAQVLSNEPIIVYQMGKVGSRSVFDTIEELKPSCQLYHAHVLHDLDAMEISMKKELENPKDTLGVISQGRELRKKIDSQKNTSWSIISLVRDPVKQTISRFFHGIEEVIPSLKERYSNKAIDIEEIIDIFFEKWPVHPPLQWFDTQFKPVFDIDIYAYPFPWDKGYMILEKGRFKVLTLRLEDLDNCVGQAFNDFFDIPDIKLKKSNLATNKWYKDLYKDFSEKIVFPQEYLDNFYCSKFSTHFYSANELDSFRKQWNVSNVT